MDKLYLNNAQCYWAARRMWDSWKASDSIRPSPMKVYGVPRGGIPVAYLLSGMDQGSILVDNPRQANLIVDDIIDSGRTKAKYNQECPGVPFSALCDFIENPNKLWVVFPWEMGPQGDMSAQDVGVRLLEYIGEDPEREGLKETPKRFLKAWSQWSLGYGVDIPSLFKTFEDGGENYDEMVVVKDLPFYSHCEHHLSPFFGTATIAYIPNKRIIGLSKLGRILDAFARRLQVQERLTTQIADCLREHLEPKGVGVMLRARHLCMESRGLSTQGHHTVTTCLRGVFLEDPRCRAEYLAIS